MVPLCVILTPQLKALQGVISPTNGIKAHGGVRQGGKVKKKKKKKLFLLFRPLLRRNNY